MKKQTQLIFDCYCGCGQVSEQMEKETYRLPENHRWAAEGCEGDNEVVSEFYGGKIIKLTQF